ncbi:hypothetical protein MJO28_004237 [Puccinia striiformis f. sp. tritici]|uniref:Uncharacterized protein n=1 Tax=Puccinia striiformis f. sp. tritici TaxID=168172 RepID=A0ACC0EQI9_9BASI|nr:hypothetical protein MJO28_004237 [Puccinia striiformis f. sp. tritici]
MNSLIAEDEQEYKLAEDPPVRLVSGLLTELRPPTKSYTHCSTLAIPSRESALKCTTERIHHHTQLPTKLSAEPI